MKYLIDVPIDDVMRILFAVGFLVYYVWQNRSHDKTQARLFEQLAMSKNGTLKRGGIFSPTRLYLSHNYGEVVVYSAMGSRSKRPETVLECAALPQKNFSIKIIPVVLVTGGLWLGQRIVLKERAFDDTFIVQGKDEAAAKSFLSADIRQLLLTIKDNLPLITIQKGRLKMSVSILISDADKFDMFINDGYAFIQKAVEVSGSW